MKSSTEDSALAADRVWTVPNLPSRLRRLRVPLLLARALVAVPLTAAAA